jgi:transketolase C-terminal domain/subunit
VFGEPTLRTPWQPKKFGEARVFDTPLGEPGIVGISIGLAVAGWRPVPEIQFDGFASRRSTRSCRTSPSSAAGRAPRTTWR